MHQLSSEFKWTLGILGVIVVTTFIICIALIIRQRHRNLKQAKRLEALFAQLMSTDNQCDGEVSTVHNTTPLHERIDQLPYEQKYEIARDRITFEKVRIRSFTTKCSSCKLSGTSLNLAQRHSQIVEFPLEIVVLDN